MTENVRGNSNAPGADEPTGARNRGRGRGRPVGAREGRELLLSSAMSVIAEQGYANASLRRVSALAGFTTGAVTYYFRSKEEMILAVAEHMFDEFDKVQRETRRARDISEAFERWIDRMTNDRDLWLVQFQLLAHARTEPKLAEVFQRRYAQYRNDFAALIEIYQRDGSVRKDIPAPILADQLSALADGWIMMIPIESDRFSSGHIDALLQSLVAMLAPPGGADPGKVCRAGSG